MKIKKGERIAIVGESGCGKTTFLKMIMGYDNNYEGNMEILGNELRQWPQKSLRKYISYCPQKPFLLSKSIFKNFSLFYNKVTKDELEQYAKIVDLNEKIDSLPNGYDTLLKKGGENLSGDQKQRLALMIGLMKQSSIYLIDEGFSALDPEMTDKVLDKIFKAIKGTIIIVNHKLYHSLMTKFDRIFVMNNGKIVGTGSHHELMGNEFYRNLYEKSKQEL
ncbi:hypothetical protein BBF96_06560 [Anoxybacter fermentans]|uniref:ABC transporter domain-containing protein n=1 Tax=Anoxybacter fermentans TaxID=1323375 RepID=A0A3Q9HQ72_9FIRM|nr:ABC transporter ATP-binding protein [Anoxybacter fermentans]AZR73075.1 hypothetical protein BBF96_06560 [Anoxybacter fermentans]